MTTSKEMTKAEAEKRARFFDPTAVLKVSTRVRRADRCQVVVEMPEHGLVLVAAGANWVQALAAFELYLLETEAPPAPLDARQQLPKLTT